jgi:hypothetical protein
LDSVILLGIITLLLRRGGWVCADNSTLLPQRLLDLVWALKIANSRLTTDILFTIDKTTVEIVSFCRERCLLKPSMRKDHCISVPQGEAGADFFTATK